MECIIWAAAQVRPANDEEGTMESTDGEMENANGILPKIEKEALKSMSLVDVFASPIEDYSGDDAMRQCR